ncbi:hypothetical protein PVT71_05660 [Salipiger sp. H15]|uniref:Uncharacterized protein n=1 Tax=Alloyangia sp. H15 TaxID=3029062 RepID=A0AAU8AIB6_9RHOB
MSRGRRTSGGWRLLIAVLASWLPELAVAQQIEMRSGEHGGFTRLVLDIPAGLGWRAGSSGPASYRVEFDKGGFQFGFDAVYRRITRDRVSNVAALADGAGVDLALACDCVVEASQQGGGMIVMDVRPRRAGDPPPAPLPVPVAQVDEPTPLVSPSAAPVLDLGILPGDIGHSAARALLPSFDPGPRLAAEIGTSPEDRAIAESFGQSLAEQLALGATRGLLDADGPLSQLPATEELPKHGDGEPGVARDPPGAAPDHSMSAEMLTGPASRGFGASSVLRIGGQKACLDDRRLDLPGWFGSDGEEAALARLGALRARLVGEFDRIDTRVQRELAQLYISLGFGAEARALLQLEDDIPDPVLMTLATLVDGGGDPAGVFAGQSECHGRAALWAVLGAKELPASAEIAAPAVLATFEELPLSLRRTLGPRLAERLTEEGQADLASNVLARMARALGRTTEEMQLAAAGIARASGAPDRAEALLSGLISAPGELGVAAAVASVDLATEEGRPVAPAMVDLTAAYSTEGRSTEDRDALWLAHVRAAWANAEFDRAFGEIDAPGEVVAETRLKARIEALGALATSGDDGTFLRLALDPGNIALAPAAAALALEIAGRFLALGLPDPAGRWLAGPVPPGREHDWRLLEARLSLAKGDAQAAEIALVGLQGEDVLRLRAEAREAMGDYAFARSAYAELGDSANAARLAWLAGDLAASTAGGDPVRAEAAAIALAEPPVTAAPSLAESKALADSGGATIEAIRALLAQSAIPEM